MKQEEPDTLAAAVQEAELLCSMVAQVVTPIETLFCDLSPALAIRSGPGTVGLCYTPERP